MSRIREQAERYVAMARNGPKPAAAAKARIAKRLASSLGPSASPDLANESGNAVAKTAGASGAVALGAGAVVLVALFLGRIAMHESQPAHRAFTKYTHAPMKALSLEVRGETPMLSAIPAPSRVQPTPPRSRTINQVAREPVENIMRSSLREERELLMLARSALGRADTTSAAAALDDHARLFPRGELREEREALRVHWVTIERGAQAGERALRSFEDRFPRSVFTNVLRVALNRHAISSGE